VILSSGSDCSSSFTSGNAVVMLFAGLEWHRAKRKKDRVSRKLKLGT
jgi:hypothetical protein